MRQSTYESGSPQPALSFPPPGKAAPLETGEASDWGDLGGFGGGREKGSLVRRGRAVRVRETKGGSTGWKRAASEGQGGIRSDDGVLSGTNVQPVPSACFAIDQFIFLQSLSIHLEEYHDERTRSWPAAALFFQHAYLNSCMPPSPSQRLHLHPYYSGELHFFLFATAPTTASSSQIRDFEPASSTAPESQQLSQPHRQGPHTSPPRTAGSQQRFIPPNRIARRSIFRATRQQSRRPHAPPTLWNPLNTSSNAYELSARYLPPPLTLHLPPATDRARPRNLSETNPHSPLLAPPAQTRSANIPIVHPLETPTPRVPTPPPPSIGVPSRARPCPINPTGKGKGKAPVYEPPLPAKTSRPQPAPSDSPPRPAKTKSLPPLPMDLETASPINNTPSLLSLPRPSTDAPIPPPSPPGLPSPHQHHKTSPSTTTSASPSADLEAPPHSTPSLTPSLPWNDRHPCYPHPNPHVPLASPLFHATKIIRIPRDWMAQGDLAPQFSNTYPEILAPWVGEAEFRELVGRVNRGLGGALGVGWGGVLDALLGLLTGWLWDDAGLAAGKRRLNGVERDLQAWNEGRKGRGRGGEEELVRVVELRKSGFMSLDFQIPDPKIGTPAPDAASAQADSPEAEAEAEADAERPDTWEVERPDTADVGESAAGTF